jgi:hypothetical protein
MPYYARYSAYTATCCAFLSKVNVFRTHRNNCFNNSNNYATVECHITHCNSPVSEIQLFNEMNVHKLLAEREHAVGSRPLYGLQETS